MEYRVRVERNRLKFAAAHFATYGDRCESLHGHNYAVTLEVTGALTDDGWVCDFGLLKRLGRQVCEELDHKFLLQRDSRALTIDEGMANWKVRFLERGWVFPKGDVLPLPIDNTTAERLAEYFVRRVREALQQHGAQNLTAITAGVEEAPGQSGWATERFA